MNAAQNRLIAARLVGAAQAGVGVAMLLAPARIAALAAGTGSAAPLPIAPLPTVRVLIVRVLGARIAGQGTLIAVRPSDTALELGAAVDAVHLSSMVVLAAAAPRLRRTALVSAALAAASIAGALGVAARGVRR